MSALKAVLKKAGISSPQERLHEITLKAMVKNATNTKATIDTIWHEVSKDLSLMVCLFDLEKTRAIGALINRVRTEVSIQQNRGHLSRPIDRKATMVVNSLRDSDRRIEEERKRDERREQEKAYKEYQDRLAAWRATPIGGLEVSGTPVWQVTPGTARVWMQAQTRRWKCVELLIEGLPDDGRPIEFYRRPEEIAALWKASQ